MICTKPFIDDLTIANELLTLSKKSGKKVFVGQSSRFFEPAKRQRKDFEAGLIGELITIEGNIMPITAGFWRKPGRWKNHLNGCMAG